MILYSGTNPGIVSAANRATKEDALDVAAPATRSRVTSVVAAAVANKWALQAAECERAFTTTAPLPLFNRYSLRVGTSVELHSDFSITIADIVSLTVTLLTLILFSSAEYVDF